MKFTYTSLFLFFFCITGMLAQAPAVDAYRAANDQATDLVHTKLKVSFDFVKKQLNGEEWITVKPHFYESNQLVLDAKAMLIHKITLEGVALPYQYDEKKITIQLPKMYAAKEQYTVYIQYTARPEEVKQEGSVAITEAKGLYFVNTIASETLPTQIWTQGETEASSCWFPTIDSPNQKTSQEIYMTVPAKYVTLSNGILESQTAHPENGTRTDYWNFTQKHAPYLFFMGVGSFEVITEMYKEIPIKYYVDKKYAPYAQQIFGDTPEMMAFFSKITGIEYPWGSYSQFVGKDYVSGAMENTTAVIHGEKAYQAPGQLIDENKQEDTIAHELFHHWFGNLVTAESWSNLTVNESFANYGEYLWRAYKYGKDNADAHLLEDVTAYKEGAHFDKHLVRFTYESQEDVFDVVSYNKGGAILHMLRNYLGDAAFFAGLHEYLQVNSYGAAEAHQLRLALEKVSGKDLNWFFNQWYFGGGHPKIQVSYDYNLLEKTVTINLLQMQAKGFQFPLELTIFEKEKTTVHKVFVGRKEASFTFPYVKQPALVLVNSDGVLLCDLEESKVMSDYVFQLKNAQHFSHKKEAIVALSKMQADKKGYKAIENALYDDFYKVRLLALEHIDLLNKHVKGATIDKIKELALYDSKTLVQAAAVRTLGKLIDPVLKPVFFKALKSQSNAVFGQGLVAMYYIDKDISLQQAKKVSKETRELLATPLTRIFIEEKDESEFAFVAKNVVSGMYLSADNRSKALYQEAYQQISKSGNSLAIQNLATDIVAKGKQYKRFNFNQVGLNLLRQMLFFQKETTHVAKKENIIIIKTAMAALLE